MKPARRVTYNAAKHSRTQVREEVLAAESWEIPTGEPDATTQQPQTAETQGKGERGADGALAPADPPETRPAIYGGRAGRAVPGGGALINRDNAATWVRHLRDHVIRMIEHLESPEQLDKINAHIDEMAASGIPSLQEAAAKLRRAMMDGVSDRIRIIADASKAVEAPENAGPPATPGGAWAQVIVQNNAAPLDNAT